MNLLKKYANRYSLIVLLAAYGLIAFYIIPNSASKMKAEAPDALGPLDLMFTYAPSTAFAHIASYGDAGRAAYSNFSLYVDTAYPIVYTGLFMVIIYLLITRLWPTRVRLHRLALIPLFAFVIDLFENYNIRALLKAYPEEPKATAQLTSMFSSLKWVSIGAVFTVIIVLSGIWLFKSLKKSSQKL